MSEELLLEIGTEEIPAAFMPDAIASLKDLMEKELTAHRIDFKEIRAYGTPRRLVLMADGVASGQKDLVTEKTGPAKSIAYDKDGNPTKAAKGFARGQGIDVSKLKIVGTEKGEYVCAEKKEKGEKTITLLPEILPKVIGLIPFPKSMRWQDLDFRFARPIHWIMALFNGEKIPFTLGKTQSGDTTYGHRFMAPAPIRVTGISSYIDGMKNAHVVVDPAIRKKAIIKKMRECAEKINGKPEEDEKLLDEVTYLLESPFPVLGSFNKEFLSLPGEVLLTTMKKHQRYFPVLDHEGKPLPNFIAVNNTDTINPQVVINGHERVLSARLSDAQFFYKEDLKKSLESMTEDLKHVVFQSKLGTSYEKVMRFQKLSVFITESFVNPSLKPKVERAAYLCKADLVSEMVGEFPELQGIIGMEYAKAAGEPEDISRTIFEHYLPRFGDDDLPTTDVGAVVSIADKLDTIVGCFGIGLIPTGTADPYALRRQCLGIINIILNKKYVISLSELVKKSISLLEDKTTRTSEDIYNDVISFFSGRLSNLLTSRGLSYDVVDAILSLGVDNLTDAVNRIDALHRMKKDPDFESLAISFKRVVNILAGKASGSVDPSLLKDKEEKVLYQKYLEIRDRVKELMAKKTYIEALKIISTIRDTVDSFFDNVLVMAEDEEIRQNRLALLHEVNSLFTNFADFSRIATK